MICSRTPNITPWTAEGGFDPAGSQAEAGAQALSNGGRVSDILDIILPVFILIGTGYLAAFSGLLKIESGEALNRFIFVVAIPALLLSTMATADFSEASPWALWGSYFLGVAVVWLMAMLAVRKISGGDWRSAVIAGVSAGFANLVLAGIPLVTRAYGEAGMAILVLLVSIHMVVMVSVTTFMMEYAVRADGVIGSATGILALGTGIARNLATNAIVVGILCGLVWRLSTVPFTGLVADALRSIAETAAPLALISIGMSLRQYGLKGNLAISGVLAGLSLFVLPFAVYLAGRYLFMLPPLWLKTATLSAAMPTGANAYLFAAHFRVAMGLATSTIVLSILGSIGSLVFWLWFLG